MKNSILNLVLLITGLTINSLNAQGSWSLQTNPTDEAGESMQFVSATEGWIGLTSNQLLHTTNAGSTWNIVIPNNTDVTFGMDAPGSRISFINPSTGWVMKTLSNVSEDILGAVLYKTTTSGASWSKTVLSTIPGDAGIQVQFVDANNGWVLIYNMNTGTPIFKKTTDGGANWTTTNGGGIFYYVNANVGYAFSAGPQMPPPYTIYKTTDGGTTWTPQKVDDAEGELNAIQFTDVNNGWIIGNNGKILHTMDGGINWTPITKSAYNTNYDYTTLSFLNSTTGWIAYKNNTNDSQYILATTNGGSTWSTEKLHFCYKVYSMDFWDVNNGWATSDYGPLAKYSVSTGPYSNAALNGPWFMYTDLTPIDPYNDNLNYLVFDGNGSIIGMNGFSGPWTGNYTVSPSGVIFGKLTNGGECFPFGGQLTSTTEGTGSAGGQNWKFHKIANPGALQNSISGTIGTINNNDCGSRNVTLNVDSSGQITSVTGFGQAIGHVFADQGVFIGHFYTGESQPWKEITISGYYTNNILTGVSDFDWKSCANGAVNMVRNNDGLDVKENIVNKFITIYPNPNNGTFYFSLKDTNSKVKAEIYNLSGQKVFEASNFEMQPQNEVNFAPQSKGFFLIKINDGENTYNEKIMIQ